MVNNQNSNPSPAPTPASYNTNPTQKDSKIRAGLLAGCSILFIIFALVLGLAVSQQESSNILTEVLGIKGDLSGVLRQVINMIFGIADFLTVIGLIIGTLLYMAALGDQKELRRAKRTIFISIIGLCLISGIWLFLSVMLNKLPEDQPTVTTRAILTSPSPPECPAPCQIHFDVTGIPTTGYFFAWDFGDGTNTTGKSVSHEYIEEGIKEATVQIIDSKQSQVDLLSVSIFINNALPRPKIMADPLSGRAPLTVVFDASDSTDDDSINSYEWDFGDPIHSTETNPNTTTGVKTNHTYNNDGSYTVTLTITDTNAQKQSATQSITIGAAPDIPTAVITSTPPINEILDPPQITGTPPFKISFSASRSHDNDGTITEYKWDFGDGAPTEKGITASHTFEELGVFEVSLTVTDNDQKTNTVIVPVWVKEPPKIPTAIITSNPASTKDNVIVKDVPFSIELDGAKSTDEDSTVIDYKWNFGDLSNIETGQKVTHTYTKAGEYILTLVVTDSDGNDSKPAELLIRATEPGPVNPTAHIETNPDPATGTIPFTLSFDGSKSIDPDGTIITYEWDFGDGKSVLQGAEVTHIYESPGIFTVSLTVHDNEGLTGNISIPVAAYLPRPVARITVNRDSGNAPLTVTFDASESTGNITRYTWDFGDGNLEQGRRVEHIFENSGTYKVKMNVRDTTNQFDEDEIDIRVF